MQDPAPSEKDLSVANLQSFYNRHWSYWSTTDQQLFKKVIDTVAKFPKVIENLEWYATEAQAINKNINNKEAAQALLASLTVLANDDGLRAQNSIAVLLEVGQ